MKKNVILAVAVSVIASFWLSCLHFNRFHSSSAIDFASLKDPGLHYGDQWVFWLSDDTKKYDDYILHSDIDQMLIDNDLVAYKIRYDWDDEFDMSTIRIVVSTNYPDVEKTLLLESGYADLKDGVVYSNHGEDHQRLVMYLDNRTYVGGGDFIWEIIPLISDNTEGGMYNLVSLKGPDHLNSSVDEFIRQFTEKYPDILFSSYSAYIPDYSMVDEVASYYDWKEELLNLFNNDIETIVICSSLLMIMLCVAFLRNRRTIAIMKMEGNSTTDIHRKLFLFPLLGSLLIAVIFLIVLYLVLYANIYTVFYSLLFLFIELGLFASALLLEGQMIKLLILLIPVAVSEKGKNNLRGVYRLVYCVKIIAVVALLGKLLIVIPGVDRYALLTSRYEKVSDKLSSYYTFGFRRYSNYYDGDQADKRKELKEELNNNLFLSSFGRGFICDDLEQVDKAIKSYGGYTSDFEKLGLIDESIDYDTSVVVYIRPDVEYDLKSLERMLSVNNVPVYFREFDMEIETLFPIELLDSDYLDNERPLACIPDPEKEYAYLDSYVMYFEGTLDEAQTYVDGKFSEYGFRQAYRLYPLKAEYHIYYSMETGALRMDFIRFLALTFAYFILDQFLVETDILCNRKRYYIANVEGVPARSITRYITRIASPLIIGTVITCLGYYDNKTMLYALGIMLMMEMLFSFVYAMKTGGKEGHNGY